MCELFGFSCSGEGCADERLQRFAEHSGRNPHGWGLAYYTGSGAVLKKKAVEAQKSPEYFDAAKMAKSDIIISHIRHASCGKINEDNCHPFKQAFQGKDWVFAHNGHVDGVARHVRTTGETDSESVFNMLLDNIAEYSHLDNGVTYNSIINGIASIFSDYEFGRQVGLNFIMSDGSTLYAFNHHGEKPMYYKKTSGPEGNSITISTQKLDSGEWEILPVDRLLLAKKGEIYTLSGPI